MPGSLPTSIIPNNYYQYEDPDVIALINAKIAGLPTAERETITVGAIFNESVSPFDELTKIISTFRSNLKPRTESIPAHLRISTAVNTPDYLLIPYNIGNLRWAALVIQIPIDRNKPPRVLYIPSVTGDRLSSVLNNACVQAWSAPAVPPLPPVEPAPASLVEASSAPRSLPTLERVELIENLYQDRAPENSGVLLVENIFNVTRTSVTLLNNVTKIRESHIVLLNSLEFLNKQEKSLTSIVVDPNADAMLIRLGTKRVSQEEFDRAIGIANSIKELKDSLQRQAFINALADSISIKQPNLILHKRNVITNLLAIILADQAAAPGVARQTSTLQSIVDKLLTVSFRDVETHMNAGLVNNYSFRVTPGELAIIGGKLNPVFYEDGLSDADRTKLIEIKRKIVNLQNERDKWERGVTYLPIAGVFVTGFLSITASFLLRLQPNATFSLASFNLTDPSQVLQAANASAVSVAASQEVLTTNAGFTYAIAVVSGIVIFMSAIFKKISMGRTNDLRAAITDLHNLQARIGLPPTRYDNELREIDEVAPPPNPPAPVPNLP